MPLMHGGSLGRFLLPLLAVLALCAGSAGVRAGSDDLELHPAKLEAPWCAPKVAEHDKALVPPAAPAADAPVARSCPDGWASITALPTLRPSYSIRAPPVPA